MVLRTLRNTFFSTGFKQIILKTFCTKFHSALSARSYEDPRISLAVCAADCTPLAACEAAWIPLVADEDAWIPLVAGEDA